MDINDIKRVNDLWQQVYPYLTDHVMEYFHRESGKVLELGPFSGGISIELAKRFPGLDITIATAEFDIIRSLQEGILRSGLERRIQAVRTDLDNICFSSGSFDLVVWRGAFFFIKNHPNRLSEVFRVLAKGGIGFIGGGYGKGTPSALISAISIESKELNERLGRQRITPDELRELASEAGLVGNFYIGEEGGLWLILEKFG